MSGNAIKASASCGGFTLAACPEILARESMRRSALRNRKQHGAGAYSFAGSRLVSCQVPETVCCRSKDLPAVSPGCFLRCVLTWG